mgnify:CR=1 FL=1
MLCKLTPEEEVRMHILLKGIADDPNALEMQKFIQHGSVTTYEHCLPASRSGSTSICTPARMRPAL